MAANPPPAWRPRRPLPLRAPSPSSSGPVSSPPGPVMIHSPGQGWDRPGSGLRHGPRKAPHPRAPSPPRPSSLFAPAPPTLPCASTGSLSPLPTWFPSSPPPSAQSPPHPALLSPRPPSRLFSIPSPSPSPPTPPFSRSAPLRPRPAPGSPRTPRRSLPGSARHCSSHLRPSQSGRFSSPGLPSPGRPEARDAKSGTACAITGREGNCQVQNKREGG